MTLSLARNLAIACSLVAFGVGTAKAAEPAPETFADRFKETTPNFAVRYDMEQARKVIEAHGYDHVSGLIQTRTGVWRGTAVRYGKTVDVEVDQRGNFYD